MTYCYIILCRGVAVSNAFAAAYDSISFHSLRYRSRLHFIPFATLPLAASFHYASNAYIYTEYFPASRVYHYSGFQETKYLESFVRGYETSAPSSIESASPALVAYESSHHKYVVLRSPRDILPNDKSLGHGDQYFQYDTYPCQRLRHPFHPHD